MGEMKKIYKGLWKTRNCTFHRLSILRLIPRVNKVLRIPIHLYTFSSFKQGCAIVLSVLDNHHFHVHHCSNKPAQLGDTSILWCKLSYWWLHVHPHVEQLICFTHILLATLKSGRIELTKMLFLIYWSPSHVLQAFHESELQATISSAVIRRYMETAQRIQNESSVNSTWPDFSMKI